LEDFNNSFERIRVLMDWIAQQGNAPGPEVVGSREHHEVADEIAHRSVTLVRNEAGLLPLRLKPTARLAAVVPSPSDLTPADTSSYVVPTLASAMREFHPSVDEILISQSPPDSEIATVLDRLRDYDLIVLGTLNAFIEPRPWW
jgi:beta-N-acetylhexosaminidase